MIRYAVPLAAASVMGSAVALAPAAHAATVQIEARAPVVELNVYEQIEAAPDIVTISAGVSTEAKTATEALRQNSVEMRRVIDMIRQMGVAEKDIQTTGINLNAQYDYNRTTQRQVFRGYQVSNRVSVKLRDIDATGAVLDGLVQAGATDLGGPSFSLENDEEAKATARRNAMERARGQAMDYGRLAGYSGIDLLEVNETITGSGPMPPQPMAMRVEAQAADMAAPVQPGQIATGVNVTVKYQMTR